MTAAKQATKIQIILKHMGFQTKNSTKAIFPIGKVSPEQTVSALDLKSDVS